MFPPFPPDYPYGHPLNPYDTGNAVNPLSVFAVQNPILQAIRAGARTLAPQQTPAKPPTAGGSPAPAPPPAGGPVSSPQPPAGAPPTTVGGWPGITPTPVPSPVGTTLDPTQFPPIESVTSGVSYDPTQSAGYWSSDPTTGQPVWNASNTTGYIDTTGGYLDLGGGGSYGPDTSGWASSMVDSGMTP